MRPALDPADARLGTAMWPNGHGDIGAAVLRLARARVLLTAAFDEERQQEDERAGRP